MSLEAREQERALALQNGLARIEAGADRRASQILAGMDPAEGEELAALFDLAGELRAVPMPALSEADLGRIEADLLRRSGPAATRRWPDWQPWWIVAALALGLLGLLALSSIELPGPGFGEGRAGSQWRSDGSPPPTAMAASVLPEADPPVSTPTPDGPRGDETPDLGSRLLADLQATAAARPAQSPVLSTSAIGHSIESTPTPSATLAATFTPGAPPGSGRVAPGDDPSDPPATATSIRIPSATASVTSSPTPVPTDRPTELPTEVPSEEPSPEPSPEPTEEAEAVLEVVLVDAESGDRVAEAEVSAIRVDGGPRIDGRSGAGGVARLVIAGGLPYLVVAESGRHRSRWWPDAAEREGAQEIVVAPGQAREIELRLRRRSQSGTETDRDPSPSEANRGVLR